MSGQMTKNGRTSDNLNSLVRLEIEMDVFMRDAERYVWLRHMLCNGEETKIGEWLVDERQLDDYIDKHMVKHEGYCANQNLVASGGRLKFKKCACCG